MIKNETGLKEIEKFVKEKLSCYDTRDLKLYMRWSTGKHKINGYCRYTDFFTTCRVNKNNKYPIRFKYPVGTNQAGAGLSGFSWIIDESTAHDAEEAMAWIVGHETWHFLCKTKQEKGNFQTKANKAGFAWMREFKERRNKI